MTRPRCDPWVEPEGSCASDAGKGSPTCLMAGMSLGYEPHLAALARAPVVWTRFGRALARDIRAVIAVFAGQLRAARKRTREA